MSRAKGGRAPDGSYFNADSVDIQLTERARSRLERLAGLHGTGTLSATAQPK